MIKCDSTIYECLNSKGINVTALSSGFYNNKLPSYALSYDNSTSFESPRESKDQWWAVNFSADVLIESYQINTGNSNSLISSWTLSVSDNFLQWTPIDARNRESGDPIYQVSNQISGKYARIVGKSVYSTDNTCIEFYWVKFFGSFKFVRKGSNRNGCTCRRVIGMRKSIIHAIIILVS